MMLRTIRRILAVIFILGITLLFLDFSGALHAWLGWMAKIQFIPAVLAGSGIVVAVIVIGTLLFGRIYCSIICPLGVTQDVFAAIGRKFKRNRYRYSPAMSVLRYATLAIFVIGVWLGLSGVVSLLAPYSSYGRFVGSILNPLAVKLNNLIATMYPDSYTFYPRDVWFKSATVIATSAGLIAVIGLLAYRNGRTWCNTLCPVGTVLGIFSRFALFRVKFNTEKCINCGLCTRNCKAACIDFKNHKIDYSRCVACMDCIGKCSTGALSYGLKPKKEPGISPKTPTQPEDTVDTGRRTFLTATGLIGIAVVSKAKKKVDGGLAVIEDKKIPARETPIVPPGAEGIMNVRHHCTTCQLCITACPNKVLRPSTSIDRFMQPESSYERGYCRPECTKCSHLCPTGAIRPITVAEKKNISIGHAVWIKDNCICVTNNVNCNSCHRHCPTGAITRVPLNPSDPDSVLVPESTHLGASAAVHANTTVLHVRSWPCILKVISVT